MEEAWSDGSNGCDDRVSAPARSDSKKGTSYSDGGPDQRLDDEPTVNSIRTAAHPAASDTISL